MADARPVWRSRSKKSAGASSSAERINPAHVITGVAAAALAIWLAILCLPWQPYRLRERLEPATRGCDLSDVTVLVPARNEAVHIECTLRALAHQGRGLRVVVVDDESSDATARICDALRVELGSVSAAHARESAVEIQCVPGEPLPAGWGGKLWALEQGLRESRRAYTLLLDADIELQPFMIPALLAQARARSAGLVSIMARLRCDTIWEKLLVPAFIFFFKLLYPFALANRQRSRVAAAAGGCILVETKILREAGAFVLLRDELIDDCSLARRVKAGGGTLWIGVSHGVISRRRYATVQPFWRMVSRTAYTQLRYSIVLLLLTTLAMAVMFFVPVALLASALPLGSLIAAASLVLMMAAFLPTIRFYDLSPVWALGFPIAAALFLAMTWSSAIRYWRGTRAVWKDRSYETAAD
jgi:hopene-associated glycosyltransferase HpnB